MRVSEYYQLGRTQSTLDFVDVHIDTDVRVYIDPTAIRVQESDWAKECQALLQSFFAEVLETVASGETNRSIKLMAPLCEPNEVHLGLSKKKSKGIGLGPENALKFLEAIRRSKAAQTGLLADLEDTALLISGIGPDIISDITTNVLRGALIGYTQSVSDYYGVDMEDQYAGFIWNPDSLDWQEGHAKLPYPDDERLILVPKSIVRRHLTIDSDKYYNQQIAPRLEALEIDQKSTLVTVLKNGDARVNRKKLREKYPSNKLAIVGYSEKFPDALRAYKDSLTKTECTPMENTGLEAEVGASPVTLDQLLERVVSLPAGGAAATAYHRHCEQLLTAIFYPHLGNMELEKEIHEGRKRIDIKYDNLAGRGTFFWLSKEYRCPTIPVECKNYTQDVNNPELDQISGRFSDRRGWVGIIVFRACTNKELFLERCKDTAHDGRGFIIALDDEDLRALVEERKRAANGKDRDKAMYKLIRERFDRLIT